jgi:hypothetical protein
MNSRYLLAGVLVIAVVALASLGLGGITGFIVSDGENPGVQVNINYGERTETYDVVITPREFVLDALIRVAVVDYKTEGAMGAFVREINGVKQDDNLYVQAKKKGI